MRIIAATIGDQLKSKGQKLPKPIRVVIPKEDFVKKLVPARKVKVDKLANIAELQKSKASSYTRLRVELKDWYKRQFVSLSIDWKYSLSTGKKNVYIFNDSIQDSWLSGDWVVQLNAKVRISASITDAGVELKATLKTYNGNKKIEEKVLDSNYVEIDQINQQNLDKFYWKLYKFITNNLSKANNSLIPKVKKGNNNIVGKLKDYKK